jgi:hypothetical protein
MKIREVSEQQINAALQSTDKNLEAYKAENKKSTESANRMIQSFFTLIALNTTDEGVKKQMIEILKNDKDTLDKLIKQKEELLK